MTRSPTASSPTSTPNPDEAAVGELGAVGTAAAVTNAVHHATGVRIRDLPITVDKLVRWFTGSHVCQR